MAATGPERAAALAELHGDDPPDPVAPALYRLDPDRSVPTVLELEAVTASNGLE